MDILTSTRIYKTKEYHKFKLIGGNREVKDSHLKPLMKSVADNNLLEFNPILVNEDFEVIDGQHRLRAAEILGIPVYYITLVGGRIPEVVTFNTNTRNWSLEDFLELNIKRGNEHYIKLKEYCDKYKLSISSTLVLLHAPTKKPGSLVTAFKNGEFRVTTPLFAQEVGDRLLEYEPLIPKNVYLSREFVKAITEMTRQDIYEHGIMVRKLSINGQNLIRAPHLKDMYRQLEEIYNFKSHETKRFF